MFYLVVLALSLPLWAQSYALPSALHTSYVEHLDSAYGKTLASGEVLLAPACTDQGGEILAQCLVHEGVHLQGHGECLAYLAQYTFAIEAKQSDAAITWARNLYLRYGEPACAKNDVEGYDKY